MKRVLVLYGTSEGHTATIAKAIADELWRVGVTADIVRAGTSDPRPAEYNGIIVAASVHAGAYQKEVRNWVRAHAPEFNGRRTAFVSVCLAILQHDPKVLTEVDAIVRRFLDESGWRPSEIKLLAGALLYTKYNWFMRWMMKRITAKAGGDTDTSRDYDYTDWNDVRAFAGEFGRRLAAVSLVRSASR